MRLLCSSPTIHQSLTRSRRRDIATLANANNRRYYKAHHDGCFAARSMRSQGHHPALDRRNNVSSEQRLSANGVIDSQIPHSNLLSSTLQGLRLYSTPTSSPAVVGAPSSLFLGNTASIAGCNTGIPTGNNGVWMRTQLTVSNSSQSNNSDDNGNSNQSDKKENGKRRRKQMRTAVTGMKDLMKKYGWTFVGTYGAVYIMTLGTLFVGINWGWMDPPSLTLGDWGGGSDIILEGIGVPADEAVAIKQREEANGEEGFTQKWIIEKMQSHEWTKKYADKLASHPSWINLGVAWLVTKFTEPLRLGVAVVITPRVAEFFGNAPKADDVEQEAEDEAGLEQPSKAIPQRAEDEMTVSVGQEKKK
jgi:hypothetical protein